MSNIERNLCKENGCPASCCHDMSFFMIDNPSNYFQNPQKMPDKTNGQPLKNCVYFSVSGGQYKVIIIGICPNLSNNECAIYPNHPPGCKKLEIDSRNCHQARTRDQERLERFSSPQ